ncbi:hypothetical protein [Stackebrandtia soli]|uniref:hypothetical protein n=1 Tax=Stackebrandtia soli TaxID=1892856 RepID=UPI0039E8C79B
MSDPTAKASDSLVGLTTEEYHEIAVSWTVDPWNGMRDGFVSIRDDSAALEARIRELADALGSAWRGGAVTAALSELDVLARLLHVLSDSAASNSDGMREIALEMVRVRDEASDLYEEDADWQSNVDDDEPATVTQARDMVRQELQELLTGADETFRQLAAGHLVAPPAAPAAATSAIAPSLPDPRVTAIDSSVALGIDEQTEETVTHAEQQSSENSEQSRDGVARAEGGPELQSVVGTSTPSQPSAPVMEARPSIEPATPMSGPMAPAALNTTQRDTARSSDPARSRSRDGHGRINSRMRSSESRQDIVNRLLLGDSSPEKPQRRAFAETEVETTGAFGLTNPSVVPSVIRAGTPHGPHDSGPVLTSTGTGFSQQDRESWSPTPSRRMTRADGDAVDVVSPTAGPAIPTEAESTPATTDDKARSEEDKPRREIAAPVGISDVQSKRRSARRRTRETLERISRKEHKLWLTEIRSLCQPVQESMETQAGERFKFRPIR